MDAYTGFAEVYDTFMDNVPYEEWERYLRSLLLEYGVKDGLVLELGCGTGNMTRLLCRDGYDMIGVDSSEDMLMVARDKALCEDMDILYLRQDMREFELYGTVRAVVGICDCMNYIIDPVDLCRVFALVNNYLDPGGVFIFDLNTEYKYSTVMGDQTIAENRETCSFIWENSYEKETKLNLYEMSIFVKEDLSEEEEEDAAFFGEPFIRYREMHVQRAYSLDEIREILSMAGLTFVSAYDAFTRESVRPDSERIYVIAREHGKTLAKEEEGR